MKKEERESWERAETVTKNMNECIDATSPFEAGLCAPPLPSSFGYHLTFCSLEELSKHVITARNAFEVYIAWTVYRVLCADNGSVFLNLAVPTDSWPKWIHKGIQTKYFEPGWIHQFLFSKSFNFNLSRVGAFLSLNTCSFIADIPLMLRTRVPFTIIVSDNTEHNSLLASSALPEVVKCALRVETRVSRTPAPWPTRL